MRTIAVLVAAVCLMAASGVRRFDGMRDRLRDSSARFDAATTLPSSVAPRRPHAPKPDLPQLAFVIVETWELAAPTPHTRTLERHVANSPPHERLAPRSSRGPPTG